MSNLLSALVTNSDSIVYIQRVGKNMNYVKKVIIFITTLIFLIKKIKIKVNEGISRTFL